MRLPGVRVLLAVLAVTAVQRAAAVDAPHGAYLGCFDGRSVSTTYQVSGITAATLSSCAPSCAQANYGLAFITTDGKCYCGNGVPVQTGELTYADCLPGKSGVAAFYLHKDASTTLCRVSNPPMNSATWKVAYGRENVEFNDKDNSVAVKLGTQYGACIENKDGKFQYGMYQIEAKVNGAPGVMSTFYTRSSDVYPNEIVPDFSEIDWEFCNGNQCEPNSIWLNSLTKAKTNGERKVTPSEYQKLLGSNALTGDTWMTYTINWQPNYVAWVLNGALLQMSNDGETYTVYDAGSWTKRTYQSPNLASMQVISIWTDPRTSGNFGGFVDWSKGPYYSYFRNMTRVVCDKPMPTDAEAAAVAMGPAWLYGKAESVSVDEATQIDKQNDVTDKWEIPVPSPAVMDDGNWVTDLSGNTVTSTAVTKDQAKSTNAAAVAAPSSMMAVLIVLLASVYAIFVF